MLSSRMTSAKTPANTARPRLHTYPLISQPLTLKHCKSRRMCDEHPIRMRILSERSESKDLSSGSLHCNENFNPSRMCRSVKSPCNPFRMRSYKTQDLKPFRMCSYEKRRGVSPLAGLSPATSSTGFSQYFSPLPHSHVTGSRHHPDALVFSVISTEGPTHFVGPKRRDPGFTETAPSLARTSRSGAIHPSSNLSVAHPFRMGENLYHAAEPCPRPRQQSPMRFTP